MRTMIMAALAATAALGGPALAGGGCLGECYTKVAVPPVLDTVQESFVVRPGYNVSRVIPPRVETVPEPIVVRPARTVRQVIPAVWGTVAETVQVSPPRRVWQVSVDGYGREVGCWTTVPARYESVPRRVVIKPEQVTYVTVPEKVAVIRRDVVVAPGRVVAEHVPAVYETRTQTVEVAPATQRWVPLGPPADEDAAY